jgi:3-phosphoshikimate 1-carboxyvinyltransferase
MDARLVTPVDSPVCGSVVLPGSKSITNRALALAALCDQPVVLEGALFADDTARMADCLTALGFGVTPEPKHSRFTVHGGGGKIPSTTASLFVGNSGTTARFLTPLAALGHGVYTVDGVPRMRERPIGDLVSALRSLGVRVDAAGSGMFPPVILDAKGLPGGQCTLRADVSSQFLSGLLLSAPLADRDTELHLEGPILSAPYIRMTVAMVREFGGVVDVADDERTYRIPGNQRYVSPGTYVVEPDASAASYFWAVAALTGGRVTVPRIGRQSLQGDVGFLDVLKRMGCQVEAGSDGLTVVGPPALQGVDVDMNAISDTVMTLAVLAPFATSPTTIRNVAHIRHKETDRIGAVCTELARCGVAVEEHADGMTIHPVDDVRPARIRTYDDHRMAMAFSLIGLKGSGVWIEDPDCVAKTFPGYFDTFDRLVHGGRA